MSYIDVDRKSKTSKSTIFNNVEFGIWPSGSTSSSETFTTVPGTSNIPKNSDKIKALTTINPVEMPETCRYNISIFMGNKLNIIQDLQRKGVIFSNRKQLKKFLFHKKGLENILSKIYDIILKNFIDAKQEVQLVHDKEYNYDYINYIVKSKNINDEFLDRFDSVLRGLNKDRSKFPGLLRLSISAE